MKSWFSFRRNNLRCDSWAAQRGQHHRWTRPHQVPSHLVYWLIGPLLSANKPTAVDLINWIFLAQAGGIYAVPSQRSVHHGGTGVQVVFLLRYINHSLIVNIYQEKQIIFSASCSRWVEREWLFWTRLTTPPRPSSTGSCYSLWWGTSDGANCRVVCVSNPFYF